MNLFGSYSDHFINKTFILHNFALVCINVARQESTSRVSWC